MVKYSVIFSNGRIFMTTMSDMSDREYFDFL